MPQLLTSMCIFLLAVSCSMAQDAVLLSDSASSNKFSADRWGIGVSAAFGASNRTDHVEFFRPHFAYQVGLNISYDFSERISLSTGLTFIANNAVMPKIQYADIDDHGNVNLDSMVYSVSHIKEQVSLPMVASYRFVTLSERHGISMVFMGGPVLNYTVRRVNRARFYLVDDGTFLHSEDHTPWGNTVSRFGLALHVGVGVSVRVSERVSCVIAPTYYRDVIHPKNDGYDSFNGTISFLYHVPERKRR